MSAAIIRYDSSGWNVQSSMKVQEKKDRQSGRHYTTLDTAQEIRILLGMYRRREGRTDGQCGYNPLPHCIAITRISEGGSKKRHKLFRTSSFSLIYASVEYLASIHKQISLLIFVRNTVQAPIHAIIVTVICSGEHLLLALFITATSDAQPTKHKWNMCTGTANLLLCTLGFRGSDSHLQWRGSVHGFPQDLEQN